MKLGIELGTGTNGESGDGLHKFKLGIIEILCFQTLRIVSNFLKLLPIRQHRREIITVSGRFASANDVCL